MTTYLKALIEQRLKQIASDLPDAVREIDDAESVLELARRRRDDLLAERLELSKSLGKVK